MRNFRVGARLFIDPLIDEFAGKWGVCHWHPEVVYPGNPAYADFATQGIIETGKPVLRLYDNGDREHLPEDALPDGIFAKGTRRFRSGFKRNF